MSDTATKKLKEEWGKFVEAHDNNSNNINNNFILVEKRFALTEQRFKHLDNTLENLRIGQNDLKKTLSETLDNLKTAKFNGLMIKLGILGLIMTPAIAIVKYYLFGHS